MVDLRAFAIVVGALAIATVGGRGLGTSAAVAAPVPTPLAGSAVPLAAPTPTNPVQYVVSPNTVGSSAAYNSNNFKIYNDLLSTINTLNGCSYIPGAAIGTITTVSPINVAISSCSSNTGVGATATISLGGIVPMANLPTSPVFTGPVASASTAGQSAYVPPIYTAGGSATATTEHIVRGSTVISVASSTSQGTATVSLSNAAVFTSGVSYQVFATWYYTATLPGGWAVSNVLIMNQHVSQSSFILYATSSVTASSSGTITVDWEAIGD